MNNFYIRNTKEPDLYWSNSAGWTEEEFDTFTIEESETLNLPIDGEWVRANQQETAA
jgi:hypothetical protein